ncbi:hypothetical protein PUN28_003827 [Cardiocondyla obscurior]|uniref:Uncharacterized protein n=1 Tax=Cardiocondyla obscurior TaxID=286306 RepID=A0AAW2GLX0_9HYME
MHESVFDLTRRRPEEGTRAGKKKYKKKRQTPTSYFERTHEHRMGLTFDQKRSFREKIKTFFPHLDTRRHILDTGYLYKTSQIDFNRLIEILGITL